MIKLSELMGFPDISNEGRKKFLDFYHSAPDEIVDEIEQAFVDIHEEMGFEGGYITGYGFGFTVGHLPLNDEGLLEHLHQKNLRLTPGDNRHDLEDEMLSVIKEYEHKKGEDVYMKFIWYLVNVKKIMGKKSTENLLWLCSACGHRNMMEWGACNSCGCIIVEKLTAPEESEVRKPVDSLEIFTVECVPPSFDKIRDLVRDKI